MHHNSFHVDLLVILLMIAATVCMTVKWIKLPYSIALVLVGLVIGVFDFFPKTEMTPELIMVVCLPALLFEASWNIHIKELKEAWRPVTIFATFGVLISTVVVGFILQRFAGVAIGPAYLLGAMLSATDPISVVALFRQLGVDRKLTVILEGESLFNDGTAVVLFNLILAAVLANTAISLPSTCLQFIIVIVGGAGVGCALGVLASKLTSFFDDHLLEITLTTILAYGSYLVSEHLHVSPVIAVVCAGIVMGNYGSRKGMSPSTRLAVDSFWEYAAFVVNSLVFFANRTTNEDQPVEPVCNSNLYSYCKRISRSNLSYLWTFILHQKSSKRASLGLAPSFSLGWTERSALHGARPEHPLQFP